MRRFIYSYSIIITILTIMHFLLINNTLHQSKENNREQGLAQLNHDVKFLLEQTTKNINELISEIRILPLPANNKTMQIEGVQKLLTKRKEIFHLNYFSADGNLKYTSYKATVEWQSNLLNSNWYRSLIKDWKITVTNIHKAPVSPFPQVIAVAIPVIIDQTIDGFWLAYLDIQKTSDLFVTMNSKNEEIASVWFDNNGEVINLSTTDNTISETYIKSNGWWYKINEKGNDNVLGGYRSQNRYLYSVQQSQFENLQLLVVQNRNLALALYFSFRSNIIIISVILQVILMIVVAAILWQWQKQKKQLTELFNVNNLLQTKSEALVDTNEKLDKLVYELDGQKKQLLQAKSNLERMEKYLNFLTLPVIVLDNDFKYQFVNRAAESEFKYSLEKLQKKPLDNFLHIENKTEFTEILNNARRSLQRQEKNITIHIDNSIKNFMVSCDYLILNDWQGYIITFSDLTEILQLQNDIRIQNVFLEKSSYLTELFLLPKSENEILTGALTVLKEYTAGRAIMLYQYQNSELLLKAHINDNSISPPLKLPEKSVTAGAVISGEPVIIRSKDGIPNNAYPAEKQLNFQQAVFHPVIINNNSVGAVIIIDPREEIITDYENTLQKLLIHFKIGLSALLSKTKLEITNEELNKSTVLRAQLLRSITHGLKTPLSTIKGYVKLIQLKFLPFLQKNVELNKFVKSLDMATEDMNDKIMMYLDMARINRGDLHFDNKEIKNADLLKPLIAQLSYEAEIKNITIDILDNGLENDFIFLDPQRMGFGLKTIFLNALKYAPHKDNVSLIMARENNNLKLILEDHGKPVCKEHIPLIGCEFLPQELSRERLHYGDSLPIALAVKIIESAGGQITIDSSKKKTIHTIKIPVYQN